MSDLHSDPSSGPDFPDPGKTSELPPEGVSDPTHPDPYEGAVPPGYDWPTHGGYLGCLLGLMAACLVGGFAGKLVGLFTYAHNITGVPNALLILGTMLVAVFALGRVGWVLGRRFYREYAVKPTWGEDDAYRPDWEVYAGRDTKSGDSMEDVESLGGDRDQMAGETHESVAADEPANQGA